jgi:hypothetical protein
VAAGAGPGGIARQRDRKAVNYFASFAFDVGGKDGSQWAPGKGRNRNGLTNMVNYNALKICALVQISLMSSNGYRGSW